MQDLKQVRRSKLVFGIGINDADYPVTPRVQGKQVWCPFYLTWMNMLKRCYCEKAQVRQPSYMGCSVADDWLTFSTFKAWMEAQNWQGQQLDKDILTLGNKVYGPLTCVFVSKQVNTFMLDCLAVRGEWPVGVVWDKVNSKFVSRCRTLGDGTYRFLGLFTCPDEAHQAWLKYKLELARLLASQQPDPRVAKALIDRYENYSKGETSGATQ